MEPINIAEYEDLAAERLAPATWDYYRSGSDDEQTLRANRAAFERIKLRPRVLVDVSRITLETTVLGITLPTPLLIAPTATSAKPRCKKRRRAAIRISVRVSTSAIGAPCVGRPGRRRAAMAISPGRLGAGVSCFSTMVS